MILDILKDLLLPTLGILKDLLLIIVNMIVTVFTYLFILGFGSVIAWQTLFSLKDLWDAIGKRNLTSVLSSILKLIILTAAFYPIFWLLTGGLTEDWWQFWKWSAVKSMM